MKLIGTFESPYLMRVLFCARLKGLDLPLDPGPADRSSPAFRALNPLGKVPVLIDAEFVLPESAAICEYLEDTQGDPSIWPKDVEARARARLICQIVDLYLSPDMFNALLPELAAGPIEGAAERLARWMDAVESYLREGEAWLAGDAPSMADAAMATTLFYFESLGQRKGAPGWIAERPRLAAWWRRAKADPAFRRIYDEQNQSLNKDIAAVAAS